MHGFPAHNLFHVPRLMCERCIAAVASALRAADGAARVEAELENRTVLVVSTRYETALLRTLREAGFPAEPVVQPLG